MHTRLLKALSVALAATLPLALSAVVQAQDAKTIKIGAVAPKTGPLAGGSAVTQWPSIKLWVAQVNERGGLKMKDGSKRKIDLIEYDDRTDPGESIKAVERLANQDKADFIIAPYGTGLNLATAPVFAKYGYPQIAVSAITDKGPELTKRYPTLFLTLGTTTAFANSVADILKKLVDEGKIGKKVAMVNVARIISACTRISRIAMSSSSAPADSGPWASARSVSVPSPGDEDNWIDTDLARRQRAT